ncbi:MAG: host attachment protein [Gammaproteobacteria bacterium]|nr:host attachment protein [Gammaproteobacteria bacterium]
MMAYTTWVVSTDGERARIFELKERSDALRELAALEDDHTPTGGPDGQPPASTGLRDGGGGRRDVRIAAGGRGRRLAESLGSHLERQQRKGGYDRLVMIAPHDVMPKVIGSLSPEVRGVMVAEMEADIIDGSINGIRAILPF